MTRIVTDTRRRRGSSLRRLLVAFPTDTVYGIGASAGDSRCGRRTVEGQGPARTRCPFRFSSPVSSRLHHSGSSPSAPGKSQQSSGRGRHTGGAEENRDGSRSRFGLIDGRDALAVARYRGRTVRTLRALARHQREPPRETSRLSPRRRWRARSATACLSSWTAGRVPDSPPRSSTSRAIHPGSCAKGRSRKLRSKKSSSGPRRSGLAHLDCLVRCGAGTAGRSLLLW